MDPVLTAVKGRKGGGEVGGGLSAAALTTQQSKLELL